MFFSDDVDLSTLPARDRILQTAHRLFYREGIRATGIDKVIAESGVTKVTFYRHFPSKNDLILAYLDHRHAKWMDWFRDALVRHGNTPAALVPTMAEWWQHPGYRGCAFLNGVSEMAGALPAVADRTRQHKADVVQTMEAMLPVPPRPTPSTPPADHDAARHALALALCSAIDGACLRAVYDGTPDAALQSLQTLVDACTASI